MRTLLLMTGIAISFLTVTVSAQTEPGQSKTGIQPPLQATMTEKLRVIVLQGQGATHEIARGLTALTVVEVRDENDRPVEGAVVTFRLPESPQVGSFAGGIMSQTSRTNSQGQAGMAGFVPSQNSGSVVIKVTAVFGKLMGRATITQNTTQSFLPETAKSKSFWQKWRWPIIIGAGGAIVGGVWAGRRGGSTAATIPDPSIGVTPGPIVIGGPR